MDNSEKWAQMITKRGSTRSQGGDLTQCPCCRRWFNVPCQCNDGKDWSEAHERRMNGTS